MKTPKLFAIAVLLLSSTSWAAEKCRVNFTSGTFNAELTKNQSLTFKKFWEAYPSFAYGIIDSVSPNAKKPYQFTLRVVHYFKKEAKFERLTIQTPTKPSYVEKGGIWVFPIKDIKKAAHNVGHDCSAAGFSQKQEPVFYEFQQIARFSKDMGLDQWLTCSVDDDCTFVSSCSSCYRSMNTVYITKYLNWKKSSGNSVCRECPDSESYTEQYRPVCTAMKICGKEQRSP